MKTRVYSHQHSMRHIIRCHGMIKVIHFATKAFTFSYTSLLTPALSSCMGISRIAINLFIHKADALTQTTNLNTQLSTPVIVEHSEKIPWKYLV